jgi:uncharacterized membrane protein YphA (DoxX/SURF4 family)
MNRVLWVVQGLLAALFLMNAYMKLTMADEMLTAQFPFPAMFVRFIGVCELLGALGLVLPGITRIRPNLTPLAAAGLVIIMIGATVSTLLVMGPVWALMPLVVGLLAAFVAYGRWSLAPLQGSSGSSTGHLAR